MSDGYLNGVEGLPQFTGAFSFDGVDIDRVHKMATSPTQLSKKQLEDAGYLVAIVEPTICVVLSKGMFSLIDAQDAWVLNGSKWVASQSGTRFYAARGKGKNREYLHRLIAKAATGQLVDHIDGNTLNNCRSNLRICSQRQNVRNGKKRSAKNPYKGLIWTPHCNKWSARITVDYKSIHLGVFEDPKDAARAYNAAAIKHFGEFARLNKIE